MRKYLYLLLLLSSCTSIQLSENQINKLTFFKAENLQEKGYLIGNNGSVLLSLLEIDEESNIIIIDSTDILIVIIIDNKFLEMNLNASENQIIKKIKGRTFKNEFKIKTKLMIGGPIPPLFWGIGSRSNSISINRNGQLVLYHNHGGSLMLGVIPLFGTSVGQGEYVFESVTK